MSVNRNDEAVLGLEDDASMIPNSSHDTSETTVRNNGTSSYLDIPAFHPPRRPSLDSTYSELSELSYLSNDRHPHTRSLVRRSSNASITSNAFQSSKSTYRQYLHHLYLRNYGALLVLASQCFATLMNISTRLLETPGPHGEPMHPFQILFTRQSLTALFCFIYAFTTGSIPHFPIGPPGVRGLLVCRGLFGFFGVFGLYMSLMWLELSEATVLTFLGPILTCYLCSFVIPGETFSRQQQIAGLVSFVGVIFIARPASLFPGGAKSGGSTPVDGGVADASMSGDNSTMTTAVAEHVAKTLAVTPTQHLLAIGIAMVGVLGATGAMTSIRAIGTRAHPLVSVNYFSVWSSIVCLAALVVIPGVSFRLPGNITEWTLLASLGICGFIMQGLLTMGLSYGGPGNNDSAQGLKESGGVDGLGRKRRVDEEEGIELASTIIHAEPAVSNTAGPSIIKPSIHLPSSSKSHHRSSKKPASSGSGTRATSMVYTQMLFALFADRVVFGSVPGVWSWIGSGLILAGAVWVAAARDPSDKQPKSQRRTDDIEESTRSTEMRIEGEGKDIVVGGSAVGTEEEVGLLERGTDNDLHEQRGRRLSRN